MARLCPSNSNPENVNPESLLSNKGLFERLLWGFQFYLRIVKDVFVVFVHEKLFPRKSLPELRQLSILGNGTRLSIIPVGRAESVFFVHFLRKILTWIWIMEKVGTSVSCDRSSLNAVSLNATRGLDLSIGAATTLAWKIMFNGRSAFFKLSGIFELSLENSFLARALKIFYGSFCLIVVDCVHLTTNN